MIGGKRFVGTGIAAVLAAGVLPVALAGPARAETLEPGAARAALNAVCAATQVRAEAGLTVADSTSPGRIGTYDPVTGAVERSDPGVDRRRTVYTDSPPTAYRALDPTDRFVRRALLRMGRSASWSRGALTSSGLPDVIPSPGGRLAELLRAPGQPAATPRTCADALTTNPKAGTVEVTRTAGADLTQWRIFAPPQFFGGTRQDAAVILVLWVDPSGIAVGLRVSAVFIDGVGGVVEDLAWTYGSFTTVSVPGDAEVVDESAYLTARASFVPQDVADLARRTARRPLPAATVPALRSRVESGWLRARLDPLFESDVDGSRRGAVLWQRGEGSAVTAYRFRVADESGRIAVARVRGYLPR